MESVWKKRNSLIRIRIIGACKDTIAEFSTSLGLWRALKRQPPLAILVPLLVYFIGLSGAGVAQLVEHLICNQRVGGSIPSASSTGSFQGSEAERNLKRKMNGLVSLDTSPICVFGRDTWKLLKEKFGTRGSRPKKTFAGRVGEWLKPADCKSAAPCGLRRFESFPVHQVLVVGQA